MATTTDYKNYLKSSNKFNLPAPPQWWLKAMFDFDKALVLFPSVQRRAYILCRRRGFSNRRHLQPLIQLNRDLLKITAGTDGDIMGTHNLVFVSTIVGWGIWTNKIFNELRQRDTWAKETYYKSGGEVFADLLDAQDSAAEAAQKAQVADQIERRANDAWRSRQARKGERNHHAKNSGLRVRGFANRVSGKSASSSSTVGSGIIITG